MMPIQSLAGLALAGLLAPAVVLAAVDEARVTVEGVHLCCNGCVRAVEQAAAKVEAAEVSCDPDAGTVAVVAPDLEAVQATLDAIADAGYHGTPDSDEVAFKDDSNAPEGKVSSLTLAGVHNCCRSCAAAITEALGEVDGIDEIAAEPRTTTIELTGDFDAKAAVSALNDAGFHVKVKKD